MKKLTAFLLILALALSLSCAAYADGDKLPAPEPDESSMFGVDKNINMATLTTISAATMSSTAMCACCSTRRIMPRSAATRIWPRRWKASGSFLTPIWQR